MHRAITVICVFLLVNRCMAERMEGDDPGMDGQVMNHRLRDRPNGAEMGEDAGAMGMGPGGSVTGQKTGEAPVYGLMKYFSYLTRSSTHNGQVVQALKGIMAEVTDTRVKVDQMNEKLDLILSRITVVQVPQEQTKRSGFAGFKIFN